MATKEQTDRLERTDRAAYDIISREKKLREEKSLRLRQARLMATKTRDSTAGASERR